MNLPSTDEIIEDLEFLDDWEQRYQYIIDLGKGLPGLPEALRKDEFIVRGCQSNVWLIAEQKDGRLLFQVDSDAVIVQGLLTLVLAAFHNKTPEQILAFDIDGYFKELDLENHITPTRGNGLKAIVAKIQSIAQNA
ncbi:MULTISPECIES: SufE family protein [Idiomarina]|jgi:cysteine desulfuration protein SufE|uniref:Cysteine desulfurase SufE subunit n=1 Tax=Idiomarina baltica OS145 TaxID=314276 RepID=A0ABM9WQG1_9GAMM|nr:MULTISPECIES: SufE family protein [Idiomarina]MAD53598.1 Fe-S cluster assembly protein SufE [Idiomarinaceae bacterium]EAQ33253.1 Cysteine desulfurase SufE subunit [Idiomarina baltica OS145]KXS34387.1 MAG: cysteine desulfurase [Idiomarina sp. T82-3]MAF76416.1 Fe-S cluster assembly protein SufE [Idiomarinaceae bacterium]MBR37560.1 Fe-S cluster assembly protein SufE [Idiomarina sp.]|tara:strand:+ start:3914 stop:4321 length:408 start_codon:yes stop_codon:yes gene_type:complete